MKYVKTENAKVRFTFEVSVDEFEHGLEHAYESIKKDVEIKGFRKGHVTFDQYVKKFGVESLYHDAINHVLHHKYHEVLEFREIPVVGSPEVDLDVEKIERGKPFELHLEMAIRPEVDINDYKNVEVTKFDLEVTDEEVEERINKLLLENKTLIVSEKKELDNGLTAIFDFEGFVDGVPFEGGKADNFSLEIGSGQFIPGFEDGMLGLKVNEERDVKVKFPKEYHEKSLANKDAIFKVKLHEIKETKESTLDDEFVLTLNKEGVSTVDQLKEATKNEIVQEKETRKKNSQMEEALTILRSRVEVEIPKEMIEQEVEQSKSQIENQAKQYGMDMDMYISLSGLDKETFEKELTNQATKRIINTLIIEDIAKKEKLTPSEKEVEERLEEMANQHLMQVEDLLKYVKKEDISADLEFNLAFEYIYQNVIEK